MSSSRGRKKFLNIGICLLCFLCGLCFSMFVIKDDLIALNGKFEVIRYQLDGSEISAEKVFLYIFKSRILLFIILAVMSYSQFHKYALFSMLSFFSFFFGVYLFGNILMLKAMGLVTGIVLMVPQWSFYMIAYYSLCSRCKTMLNKGLPANAFFILTMAGFVVIGSLTESYVTLPIMKKILLKY